MARYSVVVEYILIKILRSPPRGSKACEKYKDVSNTTCVCQPLRIMFGGLYKAV